MFKNLWVNLHIMRSLSFLCTRELSCGSKSTDTITETVPQVFISSHFHRPSLQLTNGEIVFNDVMREISNGGMARVQWLLVAIVAAVTSRKGN